MKPNYFHVMEVFPKTEKEKINRKALGDIVAKKILGQQKK
jgi:acyl-coenzyme A synthetase/AMP-(fatty) acid ligase